MVLSKYTEIFKILQFKYLINLNNLNIKSMEG